MTRFICAVIKLFTHRTGRRIEQFGSWLGGEE